jgi:hypothetical protein
MLLTLPFEGASIVSPVPVAAWTVNGKRVDFFGVTPATAEIPVLDVSHCTLCGCKASGVIRSCQAPVCPSRDRKAA